MSNKQKLIYCSILLLVAIISGKMCYDQFTNVSKESVVKQYNDLLDTNEKYLELNPATRIALFSQNVNLQPGEYVVGSDNNPNNTIINPGQAAFVNLTNKSNSVTINGQEVKVMANQTTEVVLKAGDTIKVGKSIDIKYLVFGDGDEDK